MTSRQDKATTERNAKILRDLVKQPQNKLCADCKRNDARWASWNIGCFVCIRCSGIHRSMGTHISKVKSVDLDVWTPEQMASIQKWGNVRANLYWEAHLKPGHIPPDHKMDSFIRSKYESRRWAMDGPPPSDPSTLEQSSDNQPPQESTASPKAPESNPNAAPAPSSLPAPPLLTPPSNAVAAITKQPHNLLSSTHTRGSSLAASSLQTNTAATNSQNELFSLDFSAPVASTPEATKKNVKQDILSLFSANQVPTTQPVMFQPNQQSLIGAGGPAMWGADSWSNPIPNPSQGIPESNVWATSGPSVSAHTQYNANLSSQNIWGGPTPFQAPSNVNEPFGAPAKPAPKEDAFGDLWGAFK